VGAVVDSVSDVIGLSAQHICPAPSLSSNTDVAAITGIATPPGYPDDQQDTSRMIVMLDIEQLVAASGAGVQQRPFSRCTLKVPDGVGANA
jgi:purine-binding chemotaxis protein CheW